MSAKITFPRSVTEFVLRLSDTWISRVDDAVEALTAAGASVTRVAEDRRALGGVIESTRIAGLRCLPCVQGVIEGATYLIDGRGPVASNSARAVHREDSRPASRRNQTNGGPRDVPCSSLRTPRHAPACHRHPDLSGLDYADDPLPQDHAYDIEQVGSTRDGAAPVRFDSIDYSPSEYEAALAGTRPRRVRVAICLAYLSIALLAVYLLVDGARQASGSWALAPAVHACASAALFSVAIVAACGLWRYRPIRHACTSVGLLVTVLQCLLWCEGSLVRAVGGLAAFLIAGTIAELISEAT